MAVLIKSEQIQEIIDNMTVSFNNKNRGQKISSQTFLSSILKTLGMNDSDKDIELDNFNAFYNADNSSFIREFTASLGDFTLKFEIPFNFLDNFYIVKKIDNDPFQYGFCMSETCYSPTLDENGNIILNVEKERYKSSKIDEYDGKLQSIEMWRREGADTYQDFLLEKESEWLSVSFSDISTIMYGTEKIDFSDCYEQIIDILTRTNLPSDLLPVLKQIIKLPQIGENIEKIRLTVSNCLKHEEKSITDSVTMALGKVTDFSKDVNENIMIRGQETSWIVVTEESKIAARSNGVIHKDGQIIDDEQLYYGAELTAQKVITPYLEVLGRSVK